jgi:hypothetical protein
MTRQEIIDHLFEASNGLTMGWSAANVPNDEARARMQAPINAGQESILALIHHFESTAGVDASDPATPAGAFGKVPATSTQSEAA